MKVLLSIDCCLAKVKIRSYHRSPSNEQTPFSYFPLSTNTSCTTNLGPSDESFVPQRLLRAVLQLVVSLKLLGSLFLGLLLEVPKQALPLRMRMSKRQESSF